VFCVSQDAKHCVLIDIMEKYKRKYRIQSNRIQSWDYGSNAPYFLTICTKDRECYFGDVVGGKMILSEIGKIAEMEWLKTFKIRPDMNLVMGEYVVMPNHFHGTITIGKNRYNRNRDAMHCVSSATPRPITPRPVTPNPITTQSKNKFGPQSKNLASIIRGFKIGVTKNARIIQTEFVWQPNYHDHIIRDNKSYHNISKYIINNPSKWRVDAFNTKKFNSDK